MTITANCATAINAVWIACNVISPQPFGTTSADEVKPYCAGSPPPFHSKLIQIAASNARASRIPEINHQLTPTLEETVDSINKLWEKESITARINTSFTEKSNEIIAAIPAYRFKAFPRTKGTAASPDKPNNPITGLNNLMIHGKIGVCCKNVTINVRSEERRVGKESRYREKKTAYEMAT